MYHDFELPPGKKFPPPRGWQELAGNMTVRPGYNRGRSTDNFSVVDIDDPNLLNRFFRKFRDRITTVVETPSGCKHFYFSGMTRNQQNDGWDVRGVGGYVLAPDSQVDGKPYTYESPLLPIEELKPFPPELRKENNAPLTPVIRDARRYIQGIFASGSRGHNPTFKAACKLRDAGIPEVDALAEMIEWNKTHCDPPFTTQELLHKVRSAYAEVKK